MDNWQKRKINERRNSIGHKSYIKLDCGAKHFVMKFARIENYSKKVFVIGSVEN